MLEQRKSNSKLRDFMCNEDAQSSVEYMLILAMLVSVLMMVIRKYLVPISAKLLDDVGKQINDRFQKGDGLHQFSI